MNYVCTEIYGGSKRKLYEVFCAQCGKLTPRPKHYLKTHDTVFCSTACRGIHKQRRSTLSCDYCGSQFERILSKIGQSRSGMNFCSRKCKEAAQRDADARFDNVRPDFYGTGEKYRDLALRNLDHRCVHCGYNENVKMLDVDHIDRDRTNNAIENLQFLCVWCHALKTRLREDIGRKV